MFWLENNVSWILKFWEPSDHWIWYQRPWVQEKLGLVQIFPCALPFPYIWQWWNFLRWGIPSPVIVTAHVSCRSPLSAVINLPSYLTATPNPVFPHLWNAMEGSSQNIKHTKNGGTSHNNIIQHLHPHKVHQNLISVDGKCVSSHELQVKYIILLMMRINW